ncbi:MAG: hypothetical protein JWM11_6160 [Planctomycetaceae bacterium]|nr:hypothetical protein [Planctomycetaceae bacterium]
MSLNWGLKTGVLSFVASQLPANHGKRTSSKGTDTMRFRIGFLASAAYRTLFHIMIIAALCIGMISFANAQETKPVTPEAKPDAPPAAAQKKEDAQKKEEESLAADQAVIKEQFKRFEKSMLDMAEFIRKTEPERADILIRAINNSKENGVYRDMEDLVKLLASEDQLGDAVERQGEVVGDLQTLLELLMSDDREKELAKEKARLEQYIKDLTKIIAGQKDVQAATDRGDQTPGLTPRQEKLTEKTAELKKLIEDEDKKAKAEEKANSESGKPENQPQEGQPKPGESQEGKPGEEKPKAPMPGEEKPTEAKPGEEKPESGKPEEKKPGQPDSSKPNESKPNKSKPGESKPGEPMPGETPESESKSGESQTPKPPSEKKQARDQLEKAREAMEKAIKKLQKQLQKDASKNQEEALQELQKAKEKLEDILRQIREQEQLLKLAGLEARFQRMLAQQIAIYNDTVQIDKVPESDRTNSHQLKSEELSQQESQLVLEANKSLTLLQEEGTAVAFPEAVEQMRFDMQTLVVHLKKFQVGALTQSIEMDVINGLKEMIDALQEEQEKAKDKKDEKQPPPQEGEGETPDDELLKQISELKMLKSLQLRINNRTAKLAQLFTGEQATKPEVVQQVRELSLRQARIQKATYDLATGKNK